MLRDRFVTPSCPIPLPSSISATVLCSSLWRSILLDRSFSVVVGKASIHCCKTLHILGPSCFDWIRARPPISCSVLVSVSGASNVWEFPFCWPFGVSSISPIGRTACHSASRRATPRQTGAWTRSLGVATWPWMNLYSRPFLNLAKRAGARPRRASSAWDLDSPIVTNTT